ncbi:MAG TPA: GNAT family N-acetyltransferase [Halothiobacillus sp.]|nr:GNAT family N-acetyltransferase [Halothiobacillus sp.]
MGYNRFVEPQRLTVDLAVSEAEVQESQRLRHKVFVEEMGARAFPDHEGLERDGLDPYCHHLIVRDIDRGEVVASTRILTDTQARVAGGFYSESEFDLSAILKLSGRIMEIGRTCVHPDYRHGGAIGTLWSGLARFMDINRFGYLIGCASISMADGGLQAHGIMEQLRQRHLSAEDRRVVPIRPLPSTPKRTTLPSNQSVKMPPLLKAYMRLGAEVCGEPCWDPVFGTADVFVLLDCDNLNRRYYRHFVDRQPRIGVGAIGAMGTTLIG